MMTNERPIQMSNDEWETSERWVQMNKYEWETKPMQASADAWDTSENASSFARRFHMLESLHNAEPAYWFNI